MFSDFDCPPGEVFLTSEEQAAALRMLWPTTSADPIVIVEPRVKAMGACVGANKQWPLDRYRELTRHLDRRGLRVVQLVPSDMQQLLDVEGIWTPSFRHALAVMGLAHLYIGPEGGLHHGAAAMGTPAVVIFGGFASPRSTGYPWHENLSVGAPCGTIQPCDHCRVAMASISVADVLAAADRQLAAPRVG